MATHYVTRHTCRRIALAGTLISLMGGQLAVAEELPPHQSGILVVQFGTAYRSFTMTKSQSGIVQTGYAAVDALNEEWGARHMSGVYKGPMSSDDGLYRVFVHDSTDMLDMADAYRGGATQISYANPNWELE